MQDAFVDVKMQTNHTRASWILRLFDSRWLNLESLQLKTHGHDVLYCAIASGNAC